MRLRPATLWLESKIYTNGKSPVLVGSCKYKCDRAWLQRPTASKLFKFSVRICYVSLMSNCRRKARVDLGLSTISGLSKTMRVPRYNGDIWFQNWFGRKISLKSPRRSGTGFASCGASCGATFVAVQGVVQLVLQGVVQVVFPTCAQTYILFSSTFWQWAHMAWANSYGKIKCLLSVFASCIKCLLSVFASCRTHADSQYIPVYKALHRMGSCGNKLVSSNPDFFFSWTYFFWRRSGRNTD